VAQVNSSVNKHLRNCNKHLIFANLYVNNAPFIGNQSAKFWFSPLKQIITTAAFVRSPQNTFVSGLTSSTKTGNWTVLGWPLKSRCNYRLLWQI